MDEGIVKVRDSALRFLTRREHSQFDLVRKLKLKGFRLSDIKQVISSLVKQNLLSDDRFAENYIHMRVRQGFGPVKIKYELLRHRLHSSTILKYLQEYRDQWQELARSVRIKHFGEKLPQGYKLYASQVNFLKNRGFTKEQIKPIFRG